jgi:glutamate-5-semialdehyde dehydrogenase
VTAFAAMGRVTDAQLDTFYAAFARRLDDDASFAPIAAANAADVAAARERGRSTTRLVLTERMRADMVAGLRGWAAAPSIRGQVLRTVEHDGWHLEQYTDRLGVVAFVFEGRPNVFADACGVLRGGNTVVFRIGSDALGTARAIVAHALDPASRRPGCPRCRRAGGRALARVRLGAVPRPPARAGRGARVGRGGPPARRRRAAGGQPGVAARDGGRLARRGRERRRRGVRCGRPPLPRPEGVQHAQHLRDRPRARRRPRPGAARAAHARRGRPRHAPEAARPRPRPDHVPADWFERWVPIARAGGPVDEPQAEVLVEAQLAVEFEWEDSPEVALVVADDVDDAVRCSTGTALGSCCRS